MQDESFFLSLWPRGNPQELALSGNRRGIRGWSGSSSRLEADEPRPLLNTGKKNKSSSKKQNTFNNEEVGFMEY